MKEKEYILVTDLGLIRSAISVLNNITPETSDIIDVVEYNNIIKTLNKWQSKHFEKVEDLSD